MGLVESVETVKSVKKYPTIHDIYKSLEEIDRSIHVNEDIKDEIRSCAEKLYKKLEKSHPLTLHSKLACYILAMKQNYAAEGDWEGSMGIDGEIKIALEFHGVDTEQFYEEELRILLLYPVICNDLGPSKPRIRAEVDTSHIIEHRLRHSNKKGKKSKRKSIRHRKLFS